MEEEEMLWQMGILGASSPKTLVDTLLCKFGLHFALQAGDEHRNLRYGPMSQIKVMYDSVCEHRYFMYTEDISQTNQGGIGHIKITGKVVRGYNNVQNPDRCIVKLYQMYISHCPIEPKCSTGFYLTPLANPRGNIWYSCKAMGCVKLSQIISDIAKRAKMEGKVTNHLLCATAASRLYQNNVDEQLVIDKVHPSNDDSLESIY